MDARLVARIVYASRWATMLAICAADGGLSDLRRHSCGVDWRLVSSPEETGVETRASQACLASPVANQGG